MVTRGRRALLDNPEPLTFEPEPSLRQIRRRMAEEGNDLANVHNDINNDAADDAHNAVVNNDDVANLNDPQINVVANAGVAPVVPAPVPVPNIVPPNPRIALLSNSVSQGQERVDQGRAAYSAGRQDVAAFSINPPKEAFAVPKFKGDHSSQNLIRSFLKKLALYFDAVPYFNGHDSWPRRRVTLLLSVFPDNSPAAVWFEQVYASINSYDQFEAAFRDRFETGGVDVLALQEKWHNAKQTDSVDSFYAYLQNLQCQINAIEGPVIDSVHFFNTFLYGLRPAILDTIRPHLATWTPAQRTPNNLRVLAVGYAGKSKPGPNLNLVDTPKLRNKPDAPKCPFCKKEGHIWDTCPRIALLKAQGKWVERPRKAANS